ncbi:hypothetical protein EVAR_77743_1 [Eumeta japonica]|uniref:Uncharacterized protein n=1 Tax=Eumeta variegata TaxID=151549 RepID=A0A4C1TDF7_EUMVA|nr:hypothetical protein EVAR_77743_1 [Eumeta japonica]
MCHKIVILVLALTLMAMTEAQLTFSPNWGKRTLGAGGLAPGSAGDACKPTDTLMTIYKLIEKTSACVAAMLKLWNSKDSYSFNEQWLEKEFYHHNQINYLKEPSMTSKLMLLTEVMLKPVGPCSGERAGPGPRGRVVDHGCCCPSLRKITRPKDFYSVKNEHDPSPSARLRTPTGSFDFVHPYDPVYLALLKNVKVSLVSVNNPTRPKRMSHDTKRPHITSLRL